MSRGGSTPSLTERVLGTNLLQSVNLAVSSDCWRYPTVHDDRLAKMVVFAVAVRPCLLLLLEKLLDGARHDPRVPGITAKP